MFTEVDTELMRCAIDIAMEGVRKGNTPFGAVLAKNGQVVCQAHNQVWADTDITAHAEITLLRRSCKKLGMIDLGGYTLYSTCEPCPMCFSAIHWANVSRIVFGAQIKDADSLGFRELFISNNDMKKMGGSHVEISGPFMLKENLELFNYWKNLSNGQTY